MDEALNRSGERNSLIILSSPDAPSLGSNYSGEDSWELRPPSLGPGSALGGERKKIGVAEKKTLRAKRAES